MPLHFLLLRMLRRASTRVAGVNEALAGKKRSGRYDVALAIVIRPSSGTQVRSGDLPQLVRRSGQAISESLLQNRSLQKLDG